MSSKRLVFFVLFLALLSSNFVVTLADWFDPRRLRDDYVPTGFKGAGVKARAVKGHQFGLGLSATDRADLISFLKTL